MGCIANCYPVACRNKEISYNAVYLHFARWSHDGSFKRVWQRSIVTIRDDLDLSELNLEAVWKIVRAN